MISLLHQEQPLRVAIFEPFGNLYGSERSMLDLLSALPSAAATPIVYCPKSAPWLDELKKRGVRYIDSFERDLHLRGRARRICALASFIRFLQQQRIDLVHVNQAGAAPYALAAASLMNLPVVLHSRWHEDAEAIASWRFGRDRLRAVVCISKFQMNLLSEELRSHRDRLVLVRNPYKLETDLALNELGAPSYPVFVCPARYHPHKRQDLLVRALACYRRQYGSCRVEFIGEEEQGSGYLDELKSAASELDVDAEAAFLGYQQDVPHRLRTATAMVLPSDFEALGRVIFEAWESGAVPVAWAGSGGPAETIGESGGGILYSEQTPQSLAAAMHDATTLPPARRKQMIENGRLWVAENCAPADHAASILGVWRRAMGA